MMYLKWWKRRNYNQEYSTQQDSPSDLTEKSKAFQQKLREFSNTKPALKQMITLGRKHKRRKSFSENKPPTIKKMVIGSYILTIALNVNGINATTKWHRPSGWKHMHVCTSTYHITLLDLPKLYVIILYC